MMETAYVRLYYIANGLSLLYATLRSMNVYVNMCMSELENMYLCAIALQQSKSCNAIATIACTST